MPDAGCEALRSVGIYKDVRPTRVNDATTNERTSQIEPTDRFTTLVHDTCRGSWRLGKLETDSSRNESSTAIRCVCEL